MPGQILELELRYGESSFYCPVCGTAICDEEKNVYEGECSHLVFYRNDAAGVFDRIDVALEEKLDEVDNWKD
jgi:hypothetical protein